MSWSGRKENEKEGRLSEVNRECTEHECMFGKSPLGCYAVGERGEILEAEKPVRALTLGGRGMWELRDGRAGLAGRFQLPRWRW